MRLCNLFVNSIAVGSILLISILSGCAIEGNKTNTVNIGAGNETIKESATTLKSIDLTKLFIYEMENGSFETAKRLFAKKAVVIASGGTFTAIDFLKNFYTENAKVKVKLLNMFPQSLTGDASAVHLQLKEYKVNGIVLVFNCIGILQCNRGKIEKLEIVFDTYPIRNKFPELFSQ